MPNLFSRLFHSGSSVLIEDPGTFAAFIGSAWSASAILVGVEPPGEKLARTSFEVRALLAGSDVPQALVAVDPSVGLPPVDSLSTLLAAALSELDGRAFRSIPIPVQSAVTGPRDFLSFAFPDGSALVQISAHYEALLESLVEEEGVKEFSKRLHEVIATVTAELPSAQSPQGAGTEAALEPLSLSVYDPWSARALYLFFPQAFRAGETALRFTPVVFGAAVPGGFVPEREAWFRFGVRGEGFQKGGVWIFRRPESLDAARFQALAASTAKAAASSLAGAYQLVGFPIDLSGLAAPTPPINLGARPLFSIEGFLTVGYTRLELRILAPPDWLSSLAKSFGTGFSAVAENPADAAFSLSRLLAAKAPPSSIDCLSSVYQTEAPGSKDGGAPVRFLPFFEVLGVVSESDFRKLAQNFLIRRYHREELAELLFYRKTVQSEGGPKRVIVRPQGFDLNRFSSVLPASVSETFIAALKEGASAPAAEDFLRRNEAVFEAAVADIRSGSLELSDSASALVSAVYTRYVYPRKRRRLDAMIAKDYPLAAFRTLPPHLYRSVVDRTDYQSLAAAILGHEADLEEVGAWCSAGKLENIRSELARIQVLLENGACDADEICTRRASMLERLAEVKDRERKERELEREREQRLSKKEMRAPERARR